MRTKCPVCQNDFTIEQIGIKPIACAKCLERLPQFRVEQLHVALENARNKPCPSITHDPMELELQQRIDEYQGFGQLSAEYEEAWGFHDDCGDR